MLHCASLWAAACGPDGIWPCGGVWPREMRVEGRRRPKKRRRRRFGFVCRTVRPHRVVQGQGTPQGSGRRGGGVRSTPPS
eukprot:scaffold62084_cov103-Phaeocystis_antarctica.AAC.3